MLAVVLAAAVTATPPPQQPALTQLKTIVHMRATPFCSALRQRVGPAIEHVMAADKAIDASRPIFTSMYHDDVVVKSLARMDMDVQHMENLISPIVTNIDAAEQQLRDPQLAEIASQMQKVIEQQKAALNVVSGFVATYQLGAIQTGGLPDNWKDIFTVSPAGGTALAGSTIGTGTASSRLVDGSPPGAALLYGAGLPRTPSNPAMPGERAEDVNLGSNFYANYSDAVATARRQGDDAEAAASKTILAAVASCASTP